MGVLGPLPCEGSTILIEGEDDCWAEAKLIDGLRGGAEPESSFELSNGVGGGGRVRLSEGEDGEVVTGEAAGGGGNTTEAAEGFDLPFLLSLVMAWARAGPIDI